MPPRQAERRGRPTTSVLFIGSEAVPFAKTGGLADVLGALPAALARLGCDVTVAIPRYRNVDAGRLLERFQLTIGAYRAEVSLFEAEMDGGARALLIDEPALYHREELYAVGNADYPDNARRFALLARAALESVARR